MKINFALCLMVVVLAALGAGCQNARPSATAEIAPGHPEPRFLAGSPRDLRPGGGRSWLADAKHPNRACREEQFIPD